MSNNKHLQNEWRRWTAKLREDAAGRLVHPNGLVATLERDADGRPNVGVWRCAIPQSGEAGEQFVYPVVLRFSAAFPQEPPDVRFEPPVWHPNVDPQTGALGLSAFLDAQQRPETSVEAILEQIQRVFERPQPSPVLNEQAAYIRNYHFDTYEQIVRSQSHRFAAAVILKAFDLSRAALQTPFCALPTAPPPLSPGDSSDASTDRPGPSTRVRAAPERNLKRLLEAGRWGLKPSVGPPAPTAAQPPFGIPIDAPFADATAGAAAQPSTAPSTTAPPTAGPSLGPFVFAPSAEALAEGRNGMRVQVPTKPVNISAAPPAATFSFGPFASAPFVFAPSAEAPVKEVREQVPTTPVDPSSASPAAASVAALTVEQPPTSAPPTEVPAHQQPAAPPAVAPTPPTNDSSPKSAAASVPLHEAPVVEKDGKATVFIPWAAIVNREPSEVVPSSQPSAGAADRTTHSTSKTIVAKQPTTSAMAAPPVAPAQATTVPSTARQPSASSNVAPPPSTDNSSSKPLSAPAPSAKGAREQAMICFSPAGAFHFGATAKANTQPPGVVTRINTAPSKTTAAHQKLVSAPPVVQPPVPSSAGATAGVNTQQTESTTEQPTNSVPPSSGSTEATAALPTAQASTTREQPPTPAATVLPPAPLEVAPFALHADAIFRELQAAGRSDLALRLRQKVVAVVNKFDEKLSDELERKEKPPVRPVRQPKPAQQPAAGAKPQPAKRSAVVYGANHLWTDESEEEDEAEKRKERPARRKEPPPVDRDTNSPHVNLLGEPLPLPPNGPPAPSKQPKARGPPKLPVLPQMPSQIPGFPPLQQQQRLFSQAPPLPFLPPPMAAAQLPGYPQYAPPRLPAACWNDFAFPPQPTRPMPPPPQMGGPAGGHSFSGRPVQQYGRPGPFFPVVFPLPSAAVPAGQQQHAPSAAPVEASKRPTPTAQPDERKELEDEVERLLKLQQDFIVQQRKEQAEWQKRLDELNAAPTASSDQPKEQTAAYEELLMQKLRAIWTEEDRRQQAAVSTARPAQKTKETRTKKTAEQKRQRAKKPPTAQPVEQKKTPLEETVARAIAQGDLLFERLRKMQDELQQQAEQPTAQPTAQQTVQEANEAPIQPLNDEPKQRSQEDAPTARPEQKSERSVALRKPNQDLLMHVQMPTEQLQGGAEKDGSAEGTQSDMRARIQQQLERFLSHQPAVEVVACWVENADGTTVPIAPAAPSAPTAGVEEEPRPSTSKEPESPAYSIVNLLDSEDETGWTDAEDVKFIDSDYQ